jgi:hypothetical protein
VPPDAEFHKKHQRKVRSITEKESDKWLQSLEQAAAVQQQLPTTRVVSVGDSEADVYDLFVRAQARDQALLVRAAQNRLVSHPERQLRAYLESQPVAGMRTVAVPRQANRPARQAHLSLRFALVTLPAPVARKKEGLPTVQLWAVLAVEEQPPSGEQAINWLLLTSVAVENLAQAKERLDWYTCRWIVELYHKVLKSGCQVEERQFETYETIQRYLAVDGVVAWRVLYMTLVSRTQPELPCRMLLEAHEWLARIEALCTREVETFVPGHGPVGGKADLELEIGYIHAL